jgi:hypothetical protein
MASIRQRERKDGSSYWSVLYVLGGKQTSTSFNDPKEARDFQTPANRTNPAKALEVWASKGATSVGYTVAGWSAHHVDHLTGVNEGTTHKYRRYIANDIAPKKIGPLPLTALTNDDVAEWLNGLDGAAAPGA